MVVGTGYTPLEWKHRMKVCCMWLKALSICVNLSSSVYCVSSIVLIRTSKDDSTSARIDMYNTGQHYNNCQHLYVHMHAPRHSPLMEIS